MLYWAIVTNLALNQLFPGLIELQNVSNMFWLHWMFTICNPIVWLFALINFINPFAYLTVAWIVPMLLDTGVLA